MNGAKPFRRTLLCVTEDWFALSHFKPLIRALRIVSDEVVVATRDTGRTTEFTALGVRHVAFDFARRSRDPREAALTIRRLSQLIDDVAPDALHLVAVQTIVLGSLAVARRRDIAVALHVTGLGALGGTETWRQRSVGRASFAVVGMATRCHRRHVFVENPEDRTIVQQRMGIASDAITELGGAGVDPAHFVPLPEPHPLRIGFSGRLVRQKGVHVLIDAMRLLRARGIDTPLDLFAKLDVASSDAYRRDEVQAWTRAGLAVWHGPVDDIRTAWQQAGICVAPSISREGLPRAVLEAAAMARPLVVTDVAGSRLFVRNGVEGLIVPPHDAVALADALEKLIRDPALRARFAAAARQRVLDRFTEAHVETDVAVAYRRLASR